MFFLASKIFWILSAPSHVLVWCSLLAATLFISGRMRAARLFAVAAAVLMLVIGVFPTYMAFGRSSDHAYDSHPVPVRADGIVVLGGSDDRLRAMAGFILARQYPQARLVFSGGSGQIGGGTDTDAARARSTLLALGFDPSRLTLESRSRNTWENLLFTRQIVKPKPGETWILAIPGYQMARALAIAKRLNWPMVPWPTDHDTAAHGYPDILDISKNIWGFDNSLREWIGMLAYRFSGKAAPK